MSEHALLARSMLAAALQSKEWSLVQRAYVALGGVSTGPSDMAPTPYVPPPLLNPEGIEDPAEIGPQAAVMSSSVQLLLAAGRLGLLQPEAQAEYERVRAEHRALVLARYAAGAPA